MPQKALFLGRQAIKNTVILVVHLSHLIFVLASLTLSGKKVVEVLVFFHLIFFQASLTVSGTNVFCGASLVTDRHLVTAAHCLAGAFDVHIAVHVAENENDNTYNEIK